MAADGGGTFGLAAVDRRITTWLRGLVQFIAAHPSNYWVGVVTDPAVALFLLAWDVLVLDTALYVALPCVAIGAVAWTIAEYAAHRWLYHARMPLWRVGHEMHHESPELLIGLPWFATAGLVGACWYLVAYTLHVHAVSSGLAGFLAAFAVHGVLHHSHHHWGRRAVWCRSLRVHHRIHHRLPSTNFGVTTRFWDDIFGTMYRKPWAAQLTVGNASLAAVTRQRWAGGLRRTPRARAESGRPRA
jgi:sterol desaturase/sphingolipid hydroxylase (fatty acid hydroxylase superfamily)